MVSKKRGSRAFTSKHRVSRAERRFRSPAIEILEERRLLSVSAAVVQSAFVTALQGAQTALTSQLGSAVPIPVIGSQLATFIQQQQGLNHLSQTGKALTDLLNSSLLTAIAPYTSIVNNSNQTFQFDLHAADTEHFNFDLGLGGKLVTLQSTPDNGDVVSVNVALAFDYLVNFTCHGDNSVTINPAGTNTTIQTLNQINASLPQNTMAVSVAVTLPNFNAAGSLNGFLFLRARDYATSPDRTHAAIPTLLTAAFGANPDPTSGTFSAVALQGSAHIDLDLDLYLADPKYTLPLNPHLKTEFVLVWTFSTATNESLLDANTGTFTVQFNDLRLDVANLIPGFLQEVIQDVQRVTKPLQPIVDIINQDIPGLDKIGIHESLHSILEKTGNLPSGLGNALDAISLINSLPSFTKNAGSYLDFRKFRPERHSADFEHGDQLPAEYRPGRFAHRRQRRHRRFVRSGRCRRGAARPQRTTNRAGRFFLSAADRSYALRYGAPAGPQSGSLYLQASSAGFPGTIHAWGGCRRGDAFP